MSNHTIKRYLLLSLILITSCAFDARAQQQQQKPQPTQPPTLTQPTVITRPLPPVVSPPQPGVVAPDIAQPSYEPVVSGSRGVLVETLDGKIVMEQSADTAFNPASGVKILTALTALRSFGADYRFMSGVWTAGTFDKSTGTITGDLIISGRDPSFHYEDAVMLAQELNRLGVRTVTGDLIVAPKFTMNYDWSAQRSGNQLYDTLDAERRPAAATHAWIAQRTAIGDTVSLQTVPSVAVMGAVYVDSVPAGAKMLLTHKSSKLTDVLKALLCYSNNFMAERIGDTLGGAEGVRQMMIKDFGIKPEEIRLASTSGLGVNRVTPRAMMKIYRSLRTELAKYNLNVSDILPVAGIDPGTLEKRFTFPISRGSVIAKTGTLIRTDGGASSLTGQMRTASGETLLFVIFNMYGSVVRFREYQDALVTQIQSTRGGPAAFKYQPQPFTIRLADTATGSADEYEPNN
ncbi:MAG: D-alanyl-D-alanine carboxypeptidase [Acidobacteria bacterium]|nr:D-alanyl-D-alanine carboxypeptidase [Acidobacteriota bacterium]